jgi:hypothetical protein
VYLAATRNLPRGRPPARLGRASDERRQRQSLGLPGAGR